jgi:hypothetical protein
VKLYFAVFTQGSLDVRGFQDHLVKINELGVGAYRVRGAFNNPFNSPPSMIHVIRVWGWLANTTGVPFRFWLRLPSILADLGTVFVMARWLAKLWPGKNHLAALMALALCPTAILISGYHGNTDSVMVFLVLLSLYLIELEDRAWLAGFVFGLALCVKVVPLAFAPLVFFYLRTWPKRIWFFVAAAITFVACSMPYLWQDPQAVRDAVFGYSSIYGQWGWPLLAALTFPEPPTYLHGHFDVQGSHEVFARILKYITLIIITAAPFLLNRRQRPSLLIQGGLITAIVLFMAPGFGGQYLIWLVPFVVALRLRSTLIFYAASSVYLACVYTCFAFGRCAPPAVTVLLSLLCWLVVLIMLLEFRRALKTNDASFSA